MDKKQFMKCRGRLETYLGNLLELVGRKERRHWGSAYIRGLLLDGERKSIEPMAKRLPEGNVQAMQQFIGQSPWDPMPVRRRLAERISRELIPAHAWIVDDTGFPKKGNHSVGVARQYSGTLGKVGNCQVAVSLNLATDDACMPLNYALYLPESWTNDPERMKRAGVPEGTIFKTKWQLAHDLIDEALSWNLSIGVIVSDSAYGKINEFRQGLSDRELFYLVEVESKTIVFNHPSSGEHKKGRPNKTKAKDKPKTLSVKDFAKTLPSWRFKTIRWREGSKGHMVSRFAALRVQPAHGHTKKDNKLLPRQWLLIEWPNEQAEPCKFWFSNLSPQTGLRRLVRLAKIRWRVEQNYQQQKEELGLDHYEGRGFTGWHHHVTMNMVAYGFLVLEMMRNKKNYWVDPAEDTPDAPAPSGHLDRGLSNMRYKGFI
ncbi:MAG: IS701 family transposase [Deltaproteobacteria bacterium]|nr:IS701 family transposase [Deltaproteobacteria bacterium]